MAASKIPFEEQALVGGIKQNLMNLFFLDIYDSATTAPLCSVFIDVCSELPVFHRGLLDGNGGIVRDQPREKFSISFGIAFNVRHPNNNIHNNVQSRY